MYVSINGNTIRSNSKNGTEKAPIRIARTPNDQDPTYAKRIKINAPCMLVYDPACRILRCGARLVIEAPDGSIEVLE